MLERADRAGLALRPASLLEALRERTRDLHTRAERSGIIAEMLQGRGSRDGYALLLRNLLPVYQTLEAHLARSKESPLLGPLVRSELVRAGSIERDLHALSVDIGTLPLLSAADDYIQAIEQAFDHGERLVAHAYVRYLGDLSGGQIVKRLLERSLAMPPEALTFYDFPDIYDIARFKECYRTAINHVGDDSDDFEAIVEEGAQAFELNIALSLAVQENAAARRIARDT